MGKSFNNDVFNTGINEDIPSINGLSISKEAIEQNKEALENFKKEQQQASSSEITQYEAKKMMDRLKQINDNELDINKFINEKITEKEKEPKEAKKQKLIKKTMLFEPLTLEYIKGIALLNNMQQTQVLNQVLNEGFKQLENNNNGILEKALKEAKKDNNTNNNDINLF